MKDIARKVIGHVRFSLLDPEYLSLVEKENELKPFIPVSEIIIRNFLLQLTWYLGKPYILYTIWNHTAYHHITSNQHKPDGGVFSQIRLLSEAWRSHALQEKDSTNPQTRPRAGTLPHDALARKLARSQQGCSNDRDEWVRNTIGVTETVRAIMLWIYWPLEKNRDSERGWRWVSVLKKS